MSFYTKNLTSPEIVIVVVIKIYNGHNSQCMYIESEARRQSLDGFKSRTHIKCLQFSRKQAR
jgi:hypothetical protein